MLEATEQRRITKIYEQLRERLLDMSLRNPMLSYKHRSGSKRQLQFVDEVPENVYRLLASDGAVLEILPLAEPDEIPLDERTEEFVAALDHARVSDVEHLIRLQALESTVSDDEFELAKIERELRDRVRAQLGLEPRPNRRTINPVEHARSIGIDPAIELQATSSKQEHGDRKLQTLKWPDALDAILERISDHARLAEQETGLSTLFLVFGFLEWAQSDNSSKKLFAPLLLLPVKLEKRKTLRGKTIYTIAAIAEGADGNLSLQKKMERDFGLKFPDFGADDETIPLLEEYFAKVAETIESQNGWRVRRWVTLGHFSFGRFAMYADLAAENWIEHPVGDELVGAIVRGTETSGDGGGSLLSPPDDYLIDDPEIEKLAPLLIHDADASQHSALVDVMKGRHLVIQGPPGTGKSQTITNIIANALALNKSVLFLAEKQAALDVVMRRLRTANLGEFCLELHSEKATSRLIIESLKSRYALGFKKRAGDFRLQADITWEESRRELGKYVTALHISDEDGQTPFDLIWRALRARSEVGDKLEKLKSVALPREALENPAIYQQVLGALSVYARMATDFSSTYGVPLESLWRSLNFAADVNPSIAYGLIDDLSDLRKKITVVATLIGESADLGISDIGGLQELVSLDHELSLNAPDGILLELVVKFDERQVEDLIGIQFELNTILIDDNSLPELRGVAGETLTLASMLSDATTNTSYAELSSEDIYKEASKVAAESKTLIEMLVSLRPSLQILGLDGAVPADAADAIYCATFAATKLTEEMRPWFLREPDADAATFARAYEEWSALINEEARWRGRFATCAEPFWPNSDDLHAAAEIAAKGTVGRMLGGLTGNSKTLARVVQSLGLPVGTNVSSEDLENLAVHVLRLGTFLNNRHYSRMLGDAWGGLDTPFGLIAKMLRFNAAVHAQISQLPAGPAVLACLSELDSDDLACLADNCDNLRPILSIETTLRRSIGDTTIETAIGNLVQRRNKADELLALDPQRHLKQFRIPIGRLHDAVLVEKRRRVVQARLAAHPNCAHAKVFAGSNQAIAATRSALAWAKTLRGRNISAPVLNELQSGKAPFMRRRLATLGASASLALDDVRQIIKQIETNYGVDNLDISDIAALDELLSKLISRRDELTEYLSLREQRGWLSTKGLAPLIDAAEKLALEAGLLPSLFSGLVSQRRAEKTRRADPVLAHAAGLRLDARRKEFVERDRRKIQSDRRIVREILLANSPPSGTRYGPRKTWTEMELLHDEFGKEKKFVPLRDLMRRAGAAIQSMKPCFMMSPLSLAKYLPAGSLNFDMVVIDEASQMRPEDALGGLLRANQLVVVGDQKQLPPTDFFSRSGDGEASNIEDDGDFEDIDDESILEACQKTFRQTRLLRWHYRSRCESLIAFSNREFYRGELITFPTARPGSFSIDLIRVNGSYEARRNPAEAQMVAEEAIDFMRRFADENASEIPTLGIVAVNGEQRDLIFEELRRLESDDELVERYREKVAEKGEPVFIKNLENVQGDERDFILISMTYGPKPSQANVLQRFGPINGKQGHRRLNVLFSRARMRVGLFTSMGSVDIKPSETSSEGPYVLKRYFEYVETKGRAAVETIGIEPDSDFEAEVADRLRARGYSVDLQVGVSGFKIDLGVRHPDHPERFLAGVECDGARYHSSKSARDRDRLREEVLQGLGWDIVRVWSTDWFDNTSVQTERLIKKLEELRAKVTPAYEDYRIVAAASPVRSAKPNEDGERPATEAQAESSSILADEPNTLLQEPFSQQLDGHEASSQNSRQSLWKGEGSLTEIDLHEALRQFRDDVIAAEMQPWERHRSILRDGMIETMVAQRLFDPQDWFRKVPQFQRSGTNPAEKVRYLERICNIVSRFDASSSEPVPKPLAFEAAPTLEAGPHRQEPPFSKFAEERMEAPKSPHDVRDVGSSVSPLSGKQGSYEVADISVSGIRLDPERFYESSYSTELSRMIAHVIAVEGPIYDDLLVTRIARAHGFMRNGTNIVDRVMRIVERRFQTTREGDRQVIWPTTVRPVPILQVRWSNNNARDQTDIPLAELASIAVPLLNKQQNAEEIMAQMRDLFGLERLRESTRQRFDEAIRIAEMWRREGPRPDSPTY